MSVWIHRSAAALWLLCALMMSVRTAVAQDQGQIAGTVKDTQGGVLVGATITATNVDTKLVLTVTSGDNGSYVVTPLPVGFYDVLVELEGFRSHSVKRLKVDAAMRATVDVRLDIGQMSESTTVQANTAILQTETGQIGRLIEGRQVADLTLAGRNPIVLPLMKAGVVGSNFSVFNPTSLDGAALSISGGQRAGNNITFDGVPAIRTRIETSGAMLGQLNPDAVEEVQILTSTYRAEYGRAMDGQVRFVTKSGTQNFHGSGSYFFRDERFDANSWLRNRSPNASENSGPAPYEFGQPGYTIGGPVFIPGRFNSSRSKLFFFASQEWTSWKRTETNTQTVPTAAMRRGDFSELLDPANPFFRRVRAIVDPRTGQPFPGNIIPADRLSRNGLALLNMYPLPTPGFQLGTANVIQSVPNPQESRKDTYRVDFQSTSNQRITVSGTHFTYKADDAFRSGFVHSATRWDRPNYTSRGSWTAVMSPRIVNELNVTYANDIVRMTLVDNMSPNGEPLWAREQYGFDFPYVIPGTKRIENRIPTITVNGFGTLDGSSKPGSSTGPMFRIDQNMTWAVSSAHSVKFGATYEHAQQNNADQIALNQNGRFFFLETGHPQTTSVAIANVALGLFNDYDEVGPAADTRLRSNSIELYAQDTWKASPNLTLELGVRYAYHQPWYAEWNDISNFDPASYNPANRAIVDRRTGAIVSGDPYNGIVLPGDSFGEGAVAAGQGFERLFHGLPRGFTSAQSNAIAPRFGMAYRMTERTVVRLGAGVFYNRQHHPSGSLFRNAPNQPVINIATGSVDNPGGGSRQQFPQALGAIDPARMRYPRAFSYSVSVQRELPLKMVLDVAYVGKNGENLPRERNINQMAAGTLQANPGINANALRPYEGLGIVREMSHSGSSTYHSLQTSLDRRFSTGFGFGFAYTWSRSRDNLSTPYDAFNIITAPSDLDRTHLLNVNFNYELPFLRNRRDLLGGVLGGWQVTGVTFVSSGAPLSVVDSTDIAGVGAGSAAQPWNLVGDPNASGSRGLGQLWFNPAAFAQPAAGTFGNAGIKLLRAPRAVTTDLALFKNVRFADRFTTQVRVEAYNVMNHPLLDSPDVNPRSGTFGTITAKSGSRSLQFGVKLLF
jgi:hypothetical protein